MQRQLLELKKKVPSPEHRDALMSMSNLAAALDSQCKNEAAEEIQRRVWGDDGEDAGSQSICSSQQACGGALLSA
jgi:hypothetical protein